MVTGFPMSMRSSRARSSALSLVGRVSFSLGKASGFRNGCGGMMEGGCIETPFGTRTVCSLSSWLKERLKGVAEGYLSVGVVYNNMVYVY